MKELLRKILSVDSSAPASVDHEQALRLATAVLLVEVSRADFAVQAEERQQLRDLLAERFSLDGGELDALLAEAETEADHMVSLQHITRQLNEQCDHGDKVRIVEMMWQIVFADGKKDHHEEHLLRRVADLLYVSHAEFIRARHQAEPES